MLRGSLLRSDRVGRTSIIHNNKSNRLCSGVSVPLYLPNAVHVIALSVSGHHLAFFFVKFFMRVVTTRTVPIVVFFVAVTNDFSLIFLLLFRQLLTVVLTKTVVIGAYITPVIVACCINVPEFSFC